MAFLRRRKDRSDKHAETPRRIQVRPATVGDAPDLVRMARALSLSDGGRASRLTVENCRRDCFGPDAAFHALIAEIGGEPAGYIAYYWGYDTDTASKGIYVSDLFVVQEYRRLGVGQTLMSTTAAATRAAGGRWMFWTVLKRNRGGRRFYRRLARELKDVTICTAFGPQFDALADAVKYRD